MSLVLNGTSGVTTNSGTLISASTIGVGGATPAASGAGISFPATQSASTDANTLDDYEEGTWTPTASFTTGTLSSYSSSGVYTKIGNIVVAQGVVSITSGSGGAGNVLVSGLPFSINSTLNSGVYGRENNNTGKALSGNLGGSGTTTLNMYFYDNSFPGANGNNLPFTAIYRTS